MADTPQLLTIPQAAAALNVSRTTMYRLINTKEVRYVLVGSRRRVPQAEIERLIDGQMETDK